MKTEILSDTLLVKSFEVSKYEVREITNSLKTHYK
jgi:hypothetical protein